MDSNSINHKFVCFSLLKWSGAFWKFAKQQQFGLSAKQEWLSTLQHFKIKTHSPTKQFFLSQPYNLGTAKILATSMAIKIQVSCSGWDATRVWVTWLEGDREKLVFTRSSSNRVAPVLISTLNLENLRCGFGCGYALPRLFSPSFFSGLQ